MKQIIFTDVVVRNPDLQSGDNGKRKTEADTWTHTQEENTMNHKEFLFSFGSCQKANNALCTHNLHVNRDVCWQVCVSLSFTGFGLFVTICIYTCVCSLIVSGVIFSSGDRVIVFAFCEWTTKKLKEHCCRRLFCDLRSAFSMGLWTMHLSHSL